MKGKLLNFTSKKTFFKLKAKHYRNDKVVYFENMSLEEAKRRNPHFRDWEFVE